jgi:hypothetical protein
MWKGHGVLTLMVEEQGKSQFENMKAKLKPAKDVREPDIVISRQEEKKKKKKKDKKK